MSESSPASQVFKDRLRKAREHRDISQARLAELTGLQTSAISHFETGNRRPSFDNLKKLADALDLTIDYLLGRTDDLTGVAVADQMYRDIDALTEDDQEIASMFLKTLAERSRDKRGEDT